MQNVQDFFAKTMDIGMVAVCEKKRLTKSSNPSSFCNDYIKRSKLGCERCYACHYEWEDNAKKKGEPVIYKCHTGLINFAIPVFIDAQYMGSLFGGQVLSEYKDENHFKKLAKDLGIDEQGCLKASKNIKIFTEEDFKIISKALAIVTNSIATMAYAKYQLSLIGMDYKIPRNVSIEEWLFLNHENTKTPLTSREFEVLKLIVLGKSNSEIAKELFISVHTVKAHVSSLLEKLFVEDRVQVAVKAVREGLI